MSGRARRVLDAVDGILFVFAGLAAAWLAVLLFEVSIQPGWQWLLLVVFWLLVAYLVLPRLHRILTRIYVPAYFIGRARTSDGLLGDPVNVALLGEEGQLHAAMEAAGWTRADPLSLSTGWRIVTSTLRRDSYPAAPVSPLFLFGRQQDVAYQQEVAGTPAQRHHVRFWRCPDGWMLPGGFAVDWLAAATFDRSVGLSLFTGQVTHKIAADTDSERDHLVSSIRRHAQGVDVRVIEDFATGYHARNGGGDAIQTDGDLPVVDLRALPAVELMPAPAPHARRPSQLLFGAGVALVRGVVLTVFGVLVLILPRDELPPDDPSIGLTLAVGATLLLASGAVDLVLGVATLAGRGWARVLLELSCVWAILTAFFALPPAGPALLLELPTIALSVLVLLALSSSAARTWSHPSRTSSPQPRASVPGS